MPSDVQEQVAPFPIVRTATERFSVEIHYQYSMPVAVIEPVAPTERPDPSDAVAIIRNLLTREFEKISEANVSFQFVGPSPLHADVYLSPSSIDDVHNGRNFSLQLRRSRGYDEYAFSYQAGAFASPQAAKDALLEEVLPELDVFYELQRMLAARRREWIKVNEVFWDLVELQERSGFKPWLKRAFQGRRLLNSAFLELAFFQGNQVLGMGAFKRSYHDTFSADNPAYFRGLVDETLQHRESYPIEQVERVLDLLERRRLKGVEIVFLGLAALLGSGLGALVTALVS